MTRAVPWNSMELGVRQFRWRAVPWNSMEFYETWSAPISMTGAVPWNSIEFHGTRSAQFRWHEQFIGTPWNFKCANFADMSSSMEFYATRSALISMTRTVPWNSMERQVHQFRWHEQIHGIPWNLECAKFDDTSSSMEFHGTWSAPISMTRAVLYLYKLTWNGENIADFPRSHFIKKCVRDIFMVSTKQYSFVLLYLFGLYIRINDP